MYKNQEILELWTSLREKLMRIVNELKDGRDTIYGLLSSSGSDELEQIKKNLVEKEKLLASYIRPDNQMLSFEDQLEYNRLASEVDNLQKEIVWQKFTSDLNGEVEKLLVERFSSLEIRANVAKQDFAIANGKIDLLKEKLVLVKRLVQQNKLEELKLQIAQGRI